MMFLAGIVGRFVALPKWARTLIAGIGAALLLWGLFSAWLWMHDKGVVKADRDAANVEKVEAITEADRTANAKGDVRDEALEEKQEELKDAAQKGDNSLAGPGTRAVFDGLRTNKKD